MNQTYGYGFLQPVADIISKVIDILYGLTVTIGFPSYALAIIMISILLKLLLYPLMQKQMKSTMNMQEVQPKMEYLQKKYKNNPEKLNEEMMKLYKEYDVNPMAGCLPLLIQFPILIGLFMALRQYEFVPLEHATFLWVPNLGEVDPLHILPILVAATMFLQQKITMSATGGGNEQTAQMMNTMLYLMPAMMLFVCWSMPSGLCLYWAFFSVLSIIQQYFMNKNKKKEMAARAEREAEEKEKRIAAKKAKMVANKKESAAKDNAAKEGIAGKTLLEKSEETK